MQLHNTMHCDPYTPYDPYCPTCPTDPDAPTNAECIDPALDPCKQEPLQKDVCHTLVCNDKFADIPTSVRISIIGIVGKCLYRFAHKAVGFVLSDESGQYVTNRPCIKIPFLKRFLLICLTSSFRWEAACTAYAIPRGTLMKNAIKK